MQHQNQTIDQISQEKNEYKTQNNKKLVRVVHASAHHRLGNKVNREKKQTKALRRMRLEREDD